MHPPAHPVPLRLGALAVLAATCALSSPAAAGLCSALPKPVYLAGSGTVTIGEIAKALGPSGLTLIYKPEDSCLAVDQILNGTPLGPPADPTATYWDSSGMPQPCTLDPMGVNVDIGVSDVFATTCNMLPNGLPNDVRDHFGPAQAFVFVVPTQSTQKAISKKAGYFAFGFGSASGVAPWTDTMSLVHRAPTSGTQLTMSIALGIQPDRWQGQTATSSGDLVTRMTMSTMPEATLGILTAEVAAANSATVRALAYKDDEQTCAYYPDSTPTAHDKLNVRDGHYALWGPLHLFARVNTQGLALSPDARTLIAYLDGTIDPPPGVDLLGLFTHADLVPQCAMRVQRMNELGALASFAPQRACGCFFEQVATGATTCHPCTSDAACSKGAPRCNYGFCETQ